MTTRDKAVRMRPKSAHDSIDEMGIWAWREYLGDAFEMHRYRGWIHDVHSRDGKPDLVISPAELPCALHFLAAWYSPNIWLIGWTSNWYAENFGIKWPDGSFEVKLEYLDDPADARKIIKREHNDWPFPGAIWHDDGDEPIEL